MRTQDVASILLGKEYVNSSTQPIDSVEESAEFIQAAPASFLKDSPSIAGRARSPSTVGTGVASVTGFQENFKRFLAGRVEHDSNFELFVEKVLSPVEARMRDKRGEGEKPLPQNPRARRTEAEASKDTTTVFSPKFVRWEFERCLQTEAKMTGAAVPALMEVSERFAHKMAKHLGKRLEKQNR